MTLPIYLLPTSDSSMSELICRSSVPSQQLEGPEVPVAMNTRDCIVLLLHSFRCSGLVCNHCYAHNLPIPALRTYLRTYLSSYTTAPDSSTSTTFSTGLFL